MSDDVEREALHDWLDERDALAADERPSRAELDEPFVCEVCGWELLPNEAACARCDPDGDIGSALVETLVCVAGCLVWLYVTFLAANAFGAFLAGP